MPGPVPNRSEDLSRDRDANRGGRAPISTGEMREVVIPRADKDWHPIAKKMWEGMKSSGQADFFQNSDWAFAFSLMDDLSEYKKSEKRSSMMLASVMQGLERLLVTEADRRRARIELSAPEEPEESAAVLAIADYRKDLGIA